MKNRRFTIYIGGLSGILMTLLSAGASFSDSTSAEHTSAHERTVMSKVSFGNHSAIRVPHSLQEKIRKFYRDVLGCEITKTTDGVDYFRMGDNFFVAFLYDDSALAEPEWLKSIWLEIKADDVLSAKKKILAFGVKEVPRQGTPLLPSSGWPSVSTSRYGRRFIEIREVEIAGVQRSGVRSYQADHRVS